MSSTPSEPTGAGSRRGLRHDVLWATAVVTLAAVLVSVGPFAADVTVTPTRLVAAAVGGGALGVGVAYGSVSSERCARLWRNERTRFAGLFLVAMVGQFGLRFAPTWALLTMLTVSLAMIPTRLCLYALAHRDR